jgi:peptide/nickel transport system ATP-binding protein
MALVEIKNLKVYFRILKGVVRAVDDVSFTLERGETLGLVGESGCGKTTTAFAIMKILPPNGMVVDGEIMFDGKTIVKPDAGLIIKLKLALMEPNWFTAVTETLKREGDLIRSELENVKKILETKLQRKPTKEERIFYNEELYRVKVMHNTVKRIQLFFNRATKYMEKKKLSEAKLRARFELLLSMLEKSAPYRKAMRKMYSRTEAEMTKIRWKRISIIFQSAMNAFNPVYKVGDQIAEALIAHEKISKKDAMAKVEKLFRLVGLDVSRINGYPHEFSGGMKQRAMIAMTLACNPDMIIADEPTTALDVIMQDRILGEIKNLQRKLNLSMLIISHDISVVAETASRIAIMYAGKIVELGSTEGIFKRPANPYTAGLLSAFPSIKGPKRRLESIPGSPPDLSDPPPGCRFHPRCKYYQDICSQKEPPFVEVEPDHYSLCHFANQIFNESKMHAS